MNGGRVWNDANEGGRVVVREETGSKGNLKQEQNQRKEEKSKLNLKGTPGLKKKK